MRLPRFFCCETTLSFTMIWLTSADAAAATGGGCALLRAKLFDECRAFCCSSAGVARSLDDLEGHRRRRRSPAPARREGADMAL